MWYRLDWPDGEFLFLKNSFLAIIFSVKVILISYADKFFFKSQKLLNKSALANGVDEVISYNDFWLKSQKDFLLQ